MKALIILCLYVAIMMLAFVVIYEPSEEELSKEAGDPVTLIPSQSTEITSSAEGVGDPKSEDSNKKTMVVTEEFLESLSDKVAIPEPPLKSQADPTYEELVRAQSEATSIEEHKRLFNQFNRLAEAGDRKSLHRVAMMLDLGQGVERDREKAFNLLKSSAENGDVVAQYRIAERYEKGRGVEEDPNEAYLWYQKAADRKFPDAIAQLGRLITEGSMGEPDPILGFAYYKNAADQGSRWGSFFKAKAIQEGQGTQQNIDEALRLLEELGTDGFFHAQMWLFVSYLTGHESYTDFDAAIYWLKQGSSPKGLVHKAISAAYNFRDVVKAKEMIAFLDYLDEPAGKDVMNAIVAIFNVTFKRAKTLDEEEEAYQWLKFAADLGHPVALLRYAYSRASRFEISENPQDYEAAISLLESDPGQHKASYALNLHRVNGIDLKSAIRQAMDSDYVERQDYKAAISDPDQPNQPPRAIHAVRPVYPPHLKKERITGRVVVVMIVDEEGIPTRLSVENETREEFAEAALKAAREWRFNPGLKDGKPAKARIRLPFTFELRGSVLDPIEQDQ